jgi:Tol biopolymer transport system component
LSQFHEYENIGRGGWFPGPSWHPGGEWLAFVAEAADPEQFGVWAINVLSGDELFLGRGVNPIWSPDGDWLAYDRFASPDSGETVPALVAFGSWYPVNLYIPNGGQLLEWVLP